MGKAKKTEKEFSVDKKLQEVLVPVEEEPYRVPDNWCWTKVGVLSTLHRGVSYKKNDAHSIKQKNDFLVMRGGNIGEGYIDVEADNIYVDSKLVSEDQLVKKNDIVIVASTGSTKVIGRAGISYEDYQDVTFGAFLLTVRPMENMIPRYMDYYFQSDLYRNRIRALASGVNINNIRSDYITGSMYPLPPLPEQQRIVNRIENLFAKLDEAKEKSQAVVDGFEERKAAVLHKAFTGKLTEKWRNENSKGKGNWKVVGFDDVAEIKSNLVDPADYGDLPHIAPDNIEKKTGVLLSYNSVKEDGVKSGKHRFYAGQILYSKIRPYLSKVVVVDFDGLCSADMYPISANGNSRFLWYYMLSNEFLDQAANAGSRSVLPKINQRELSRIKVRTTSVDEQEKVVELLDRIIYQEQRVKEYAEDILTKIDVMKKAILVRAFRGELGTNDPNDESAEELLKQVL